MSIDLHELAKEILEIVDYDIYKDALELDEQDEYCLIDEVAEKLSSALSDE